MTEHILLYLLVCHWFADFVMQTDEMAKGKSSSWKWLTFHTGVYSFIWFICIWLFTHNIELSFAFAWMTFLFHTATDAITSRITSYYYKKADYHNFFIVIGFDQMLHYIQLYLTYKALFL